jgi:hypothetical protein
MLSAREVVAKGSRWRIGNGESVKIWHDNWLPSQAGFKVLTPINTLDSNAVVAKLIDVIFFVFNSFEAKQIVSIPLSIRRQVDLARRKGWIVLSYVCVSSIAGDEKSLTLAGPSSDFNSSMWKEIWRTPLPNCIKNFLWRLTKSILPTRGNLLKKGLNIDVSCPLCNENSETDDH